MPLEGLDARPLTQAGTATHRPHPLPDGGKLRTLRDAGSYISRLPKREHDTPAWHAAIGIMRALYPGDDVPTPIRKAARKYRIVR
jgi:hypothetical protein